MEVRERTRRRVAFRLLEKSGRITPREVLEAQAKTGMMLEAGDWQKCALAVMTHAAGYFDEAHAAACPDSPFSLDMAGFLEGRMLQVFAYDYGAGFAQGFDDHPLVQGGYLWERRGWRDGKRARRFVFGTELAE